MHAERRFADARAGPDHHKLPGANPAGGEHLVDLGQAARHPVEDARPFLAHLGDALKVVIEQLAQRYTSGNVDFDGKVADTLLCPLDLLRRRRVIGVGRVQNLAGDSGKFSLYRCLADNLGVPQDAGMSGAGFGDTDERFKPADAVKGARALHPRVKFDEVTAALMDHADDLGEDDPMFGAVQVVGVQDRFNVRYLGGGLHHRAQQCVLDLGFGRRLAVEQLAELDGGRERRLLTEGPSPTWARGVQPPVRCGQALPNV